MTNLPFVSVIIATFNDELTINLTLESVYQAFKYYKSLDGEAELIIVNDGSSDKTKLIVQEWLKSDRFNNIRFIDQENQGITRSLQNGFNNIDNNCKYVIRIDADAFFIQEKWLYQMVVFADLDESIGGVGVTVVNPFGRIEKQGDQLFAEVADNSSNYISNGKNYLTLALKDKLREVDYMAGTCSCIRRTEWTTDVNYRLWTEDIDQALTIRLNNKKNFIITDLILFHLGYGFGRVKRYNGNDVELATSSLNLFRISISTFISSIVGLKRWIIFVGIFKNIGFIKPNPLRTRETIVYKNNKYFLEKWGFTENEVDIKYVKQKYIGTELCWRWEQNCKLKSERIMKLYGESFDTNKK